MANGHGGKRTGAGRPAGTKNKRTEDLAKKAEALGVCPAEAMLLNIKWAMDQLEGEDTKVNQSELRDVIHKNAKDVAPYLYPKLAATSLEGPGDDGELVVKITREIVK